MAWHLLSPVLGGVGRIASVLIFLTCMTVIAELADRAGLFRVAGHLAARAAGGSVLVLWLGVVVVASVCTVVLSLDATAVLLTPVVLLVAAQLDLSRELFSYTIVWLANTASLALPVSNVTNLLAMSWLPRGGGNGVALESGYAGLMWPSAVAAVLITTSMLAVLHRAELRRSYSPPSWEPVQDRVLLMVATIVCVALAAAIALGVAVTAAVAVGAGIMVIGALVRQRSAVRPSLVPWAVLLGVAALLILAQLAHTAGLDQLLLAATGTGDSSGALLRLSAVAAVGANLANNLPAYLALEPVATSPLRVAALLIGVNTGPLVLPWGSLATVLWAARCRSAGVQIDWVRFARRGLLLVPLLVVGCTLATVVRVALFR